MNRIQIVYHGTSAVNAKRILRQGFNAGTYFAKHLEDALGYGGAWIFEVAIPTHLVPRDNWQFILDTTVLPEFIVRVTQYKPAKMKYDNMVLRHMVSISNQTKRETKWMQANMRAHPNDYSKDELVAYGIVN